MSVTLDGPAWVVRLKPAPTTNGEPVAVNVQSAVATGRAMASVQKRGRVAAAAVVTLQGRFAMLVKEVMPAPSVK